MSSYDNISNVEVTFYNAYQPTSSVAFTQTPFTLFASPLSLINLSPNFTTDITGQIPSNTSSIIKMEIIVLETVADLTANQDTLFEINFTSIGIS
jgi:hypothetical protein